MSYLVKLAKRFMLKYSSDKNFAKSMQDMLDEEMFAYAEESDNPRYVKLKLRLRNILDDVNTTIENAGIFADISELNPAKTERDGSPVFTENAKKGIELVKIFYKNFNDIYFNIDNLSLAEMLKPIYEIVGALKQIKESNGIDRFGEKYSQCLYFRAIIADAKAKEVRGRYSNKNEINPLKKKQLDEISVGAIKRLARIDELFRDPEKGILSVLKLLPDVGVKLTDEQSEVLKDDVELINAEPRKLLPHEFEKAITTNSYELGLDGTNPIVEQQFIKSSDNFDSKYQPKRNEFKDISTLDLLRKLTNSIRNTNFKIDTPTTKAYAKEIKFRVEDAKLRYLLENYSKYEKVEPRDVSPEPVPFVPKKFQEVKDESLRQDLLTEMKERQEEEKNLLESYKDMKSGE